MNLIDRFFEKFEASRTFRTRSLIGACALLLALVAVLLLTAHSTSTRATHAFAGAVIRSTPPQVWVDALPDDRPATGGEKALAPSDGGWEGASDAALLDYLTALAQLPHYDESRAGRYLNYYGSSRWTHEQILRIVNTDADRVPYEDAQDADLSRDTLLLANKHSFLGDYEPDDLVDLGKRDTAYGYGSLRRAAADAFIALSDAAEADGLHLICNSSYRSRRLQQSLYNDYAHRHSVAEADAYSARPGFSEHQTGLALDIAARDGTYDVLDGTPEAEWLAAHAHEYGFILRYGEGMEYITGYTHEPWHYRYVGPDAAAYIHANGLTFEEYYAYCVVGNEAN